MGQKWPAGQLIQELAPELVEYLPAGQGKHAPILVAP